MNGSLIDSFRNCLLGGGSVGKSYATLVTPWTVAGLCLWQFSGKNTGVDCHFLIQGNLPGPTVYLVHSEYQTPLFHVSYYNSPMSSYCDSLHFTERKQEQKGSDT